MCYIGSKKKKYRSDPVIHYNELQSWRLCDLFDCSLARFVMQIMQKLPVLLHR